MTTDWTAVRALYRTLLGSLATRGRLLAMGLLGFVSILLSILVRTSSVSNRPDSAYMVVDAYGLSVLVPIVALVFSTAALGDPAEDGTLVYLWLRPVPRWQLALVASAAALTITVPTAVIPVVLGAAICGVGGSLPLGAACGALLAAVAYTAVFTGLGLRVRRALAWGLAYLLIWEQAVARVARGPARLSINADTRTLVARMADHFPLPRNAMSMEVAVAIPAAAAVLALIFTAWSLDNGEIA